MNAAMKAIALTDDVSIVRALEFFHSEISKVLQASTSGLLEYLNCLPNRDQSVGSLIDYLFDNAGRHLCVAESVSLARWILVAVAESPDGERFVLHCVQEWPDERQTVGNTVSIGMIGALWLVLATTEVVYKDGVLEVHKKPVVPEQVEITASVLKTKLQMLMYDPDSAHPNLKDKHVVQAAKKKPTAAKKKDGC